MKMIVSTDLVFPIDMLIGSLQVYDLALTGVSGSLGTAGNTYSYIAKRKTRQKLGKLQNLKPCVSQGTMAWTKT